MARSGFIYTVENPRLTIPRPMAIFTVLHEAKTYTKSLTEEVQICRIRVQRGGVALWDTREPVEE